MSDRQNKRQILFACHDECRLYNLMSPDGCFYKVKKGQPQLAAQKRIHQFKMVVSLFFHAVFRRRPDWDAHPSVRLQQGECYTKARDIVDAFETDYSDEPEQDGRYH